MAFYKTRNTGMGNGIRRMFTKILGNLLEDSGECFILAFRGIFEKIPGNVREDSGNVQEDFGECY